MTPLVQHAVKSGAGIYVSAKNRFNGLVPRLAYTKML